MSHLILLSQGLCDPLESSSELAYRNCSRRKPACDNFTEGQIQKSKLVRNTQTISIDFHRRKYNPRTYLCNRLAEAEDVLVRVFVGHPPINDAL